MKLSHIIPLRRIVLETSLSPDEVSSVLGEIMGKRSWTSMVCMPRNDDAPYRGSVSETGFRLLRNINYRNSFQPVIKGEIETATFGSRIKVTMRLMWPILVFSAIWMLGATFGSFAAVTSVVRGDAAPAVLAAFAMPLFGIALISGAFGYEAAKTEKSLRGLFPPALGLRNAGPYREAGEAHQRGASDAHDGRVVD